VGSIAGVAATAGPLISGVLTSTVGWRWAFAINLPIGGLCVALTLRQVRHPADRSSRPIDGLAQASVLTAVVGFIGGLNEVGRFGLFSPVVIGAFLVSLLAAGLFALRQRLSPIPTIPLPMMASRAFTGGTLIGFLFNFGFYGMIFAASVFFQQHNGLSPALAGIAPRPAAAVTMTAATTGYAGTASAALNTSDRPGQPRASQ